LTPHADLDTLTLSVEHDVNTVWGQRCSGHHTLRRVLLRYHETPIEIDMASKAVLA
jgi:hypothetical protein